MSDSRKRSKIHRRREKDVWRKRQGKEFDQLRQKKEEVEEEEGVEERKKVSKTNGRRRKSEEEKKKELRFVSKVNVESFVLLPLSLCLRVSIVRDSVPGL